MSIKQGFCDTIIDVALNNIVPTKELNYKVRMGKKYQQVLMSIKEIGLVEHLVVIPAPEDGKYLLLDGHMRFMALQELGRTSVRCLQAHDNEAYSYNKYVARLTPIQEQRMTLKVLDLGVSEEKVAKALGVTRKTLQERVSIIKSIAPEVVELLKDKPMVRSAFRFLRKLKPSRQLAVAHIMIEQNNYSVPFIQSLYDATPAEERVDAGKPKKQADPRLAAQQAMLEEENHALSKKIEVIKATYNRDMFHMTAAQSYLKRLMSNDKVASYLQTYHEAIYEKFEEIVAFDLYKSESQKRETQPSAT